jgi:hypothetical protein
VGTSGPPIAIPKELTASTFRKKLKGQFHIAAKHSEGLHFDVFFRPLPGLDSLTIDVPKEPRVTAEGLCDLLGLVAWMRSEAHSKFDVVVTGESNLPVALSPSSQDHLLGSDGAFQSHKPVVLSLREIRLPSFDGIGLQDDAMNRASIVEQADQILEDVASTDDGSLLVPIVKRCLGEFVVEGLLNSYEHAFMDARARGNRSVWVCVMLLPTNDSRFISRTFGSELEHEDGSEVRWATVACSEAKCFVDAVVLLSSA